MNSQQLQEAIDKTLEAVKTIRPAYDPEAYRAALDHLKKLYVIQSERAALVSKPLIKPGSFYETNL
jgi:hypothetical protein